MRSARGGHRRALGLLLLCSPRLYECSGRRPEPKVPTGPGADGALGASDGRVPSNDARDPGAAQPGRAEGDGRLPLPARRVPRRARRPRGGRDRRSSAVGRPARPLGPSPDRSGPADPSAVDRVPARDALGGERRRPVPPEPRVRRTDRRRSRGRGVGSCPTSARPATTPRDRRPARRHRRRAGADRPPHRSEACHRPRAAPRALLPAGVP